MKRRICVITGTRADYGILNPIIRKIQENPSLELCIIVTCMHLMKEFGYTVKEIEKDGFPIYEKVNISYKEDTGEAMAYSVGKAIIKFSKVFEKTRPDIVLLLGDRGEMLSAAIAANYLNIAVAHIHGGEVSGHVDGIFRHAITKLSHIHFPATSTSEKRILRLGEEPWRVFVVGAPSLDGIFAEDFISKRDLLNKYNLIDGEKLILVVQHPVSFQTDCAAKQMAETMKAVVKFRLQTIVIYPNADAGGRRMISVIRNYRKFTFVKTYENIPHKDYIGLLRIASVLVGNSSSGIIEAPLFRLPVVNTGNRQEGRERSSNVIDVPHKANRIEEAIRKALYNNKFHLLLKRCKNCYGDGHAAERIGEVLSKIGLSNKLLQKKITY